MDMANTIRNIRKFYKLTQSEFSTKISISRNALINYEKGARTPPVAVLVRISEEFKVPLTDLIPSTLSVTSEDVSYLENAGLVDKTIVSKKSTQEECLAAFIHFLDIHNFPVDILGSDEIKDVHERAINCIEFELSKLGYIKVSDNN